MLVVHTTIPFDPDSRDALLDHAARLVRETREEPGVLDYTAATAVADDHVLQFVERYEDEAAHEAHADTDHYRAFNDALPELVAGEIETHVFEVAFSESACFDAEAVASTDN